ncbi:MAG: cohesin domain-containing protein [Clostridia bacterium]
MKKVVAIMMVIILSVMLTGITFAVGETNFDVELVPNKTTVKQGDTVEISVKIKSLTDVGEGINAFMGTFSYDTTKFEAITSSNIASQNGWGTPEYNDVNGKIVVEKGSYVNTEEVI